MPDMISYKIVKDSLNIALPSVRPNSQFKTATNQDNNSKFVSSSSDYIRFLKQTSAYKNRR